VLGGSALILRSSTARLRLTSGASEAREAIDCDREATAADGVTLARWRPRVERGSSLVLWVSSCLCPARPGDSLSLALVGDPASLMGLTSLSGRVGEVGRVPAGACPRLFHGVEDRLRKAEGRESVRGTGVTFADPG
jgi:hypothetical protein